MFVCERTALLAAVEAVGPLVRPGAVALVAAVEPDMVTVTAGQPGRGARVTTLGRVLLAGQVSVPLAPLRGALRAGVGSTRVEVAANESRAVVAVGGDSPTARQFSFDRAAAGIATAWPEVPADATAVVLPSAAFVRLVGRGGFAAVPRSPFAVGWATAGIQIAVSPGRVTVASTDGLLLAAASAPAETPAGQAARAFLVPAAVARAWASAAKGAETVRLSFTAAAAVFEAGSLAAWSVPLAGAFPRWEPGTPALPNGIAVPTERLAVEVAAAVAVADPTEPRLILAVRPGALTLRAATGVGRVTLRIPVAGFKGPAVEVPLDGRRLAAIVRAYRREPTLTISYGTDAQPVALGAGADSRCLLAPWVEREEPLTPRQQEGRR